VNQTRALSAASQPRGLKSHPVVQPAQRLAERFRHMIHRETGIHLPAAKDAMIETRLRSRIAALGLPRAEDYFRHLFEEGGLEEEMPRIVELVTTNKTDFWREPAHFDLLRSLMIPSALRRGRGGRRVAFKLWSAAASTGAEAWSAAMLLAAERERHPQLEWGILGTDISSRVLDTARRAIYPDSELRPVPADLRERYAMMGRTSDGRTARRIAPPLRARVRFEELNLMDIPYPVDRDLDAIFLRNVLIYFDTPTQERVIAAMVSHLRAGGHLVVGHSESMTVRHPALRHVAPAVYERQSEPA
jgi:chemotaxis protein methyltransferase CheR